MAIKKKVIKMDLSERSINAAIREIEEYKQTLLFKTRELLDELGRIGLKVINGSMTNVIGTSNPNHFAYVKVNASGNNMRATIILQGRDIMFIEYGAGIHYNGAVGTSPNPNGQKFGYTIGSYGKGRGAEDSWTYYDEEKGGFRRSHGTKAAMPMYNAETEIRKQVDAIAKKVFGG